MYIYENPDWPHFIVDLSRTEKLEDKISELKYFLDGMLMMISDRNSEIASFLSDSLKASWAIEGIDLSDIDIYSSIAKRLGIPYAVKNTKSYYDGITDVLFDAVTNHCELSVDRILYWHKKIVDGNPGIRKGSFRDGSVYVVSGKHKNTEIVYEAPPAASVPTMMNDFIAFINSHKYSDSVMAAVAHFFFVAVHPFEDGNGRIARIISDYLLSRSSDSLPAAFVSTEIKKKQSEYYGMLRAASLSTSMDITDWVVWFLEKMIDAYNASIIKVHMSFKVREFFQRAERFNLNDRQMKFLKKILNEDREGKITAKKFAVITGCHPDTANRDLKKLVDCGLLMKEEGGSKNTHYSILLN